MPSIRHLVHVKAAPEAVYQAITTPAGLAGWWTREATADDAVGGFATFRFGERYFDRMKITALEPGRRVEWECVEGDKEWIGTTFLFDLESDQGHTVLRFTHADWREETDFFAHCNYHWGYYIRSLKLFAETGEGTPYDE